MMTFKRSAGYFAPIHRKYLSSSGCWEVCHAKKVPNLCEKSKCAACKILELNSFFLAVVSTFSGVYTLGPFVCPVFPQQRSGGRYGLCRCNLSHWNLLTIVTSARKFQSKSLLDLFNTVRVFMSVSTSPSILLWSLLGEHFFSSSRQAAVHILHITGMAPSAVV